MKSKFYYKKGSKARRMKIGEKFSKNVVSAGDFQVDHRKLWSTSFTTVAKVWPLVACLDCWPTGTTWPGAKAPPFG